MDKLYVPLLVLLTSLIGYWYTRRRLSLEPGDVKQAIGGTLELIGCWVMVYIANLLVGLVAILLIRRITGFFISVYVLKGVMLVLFTILQALVLYHLWCRSRRKQSKE